MGSSYKLVLFPVPLKTRTAIAVAFFAIPYVLEIASPIHVCMYMNSNVCKHVEVCNRADVLPATLVPCPKGSDLGELTIV